MQGVECLLDELHAIAGSQAPFMLLVGQSADHYRCQYAERPPLPAKQFVANLLSHWLSSWYAQVEQNIVNLTLVGLQAGDAARLIGRQLLPDSHEACHELVGVALTQVLSMAHSDDVAHVRNGHIDRAIVLAFVYYQFSAIVRRRRPVPCDAWDQPTATRQIETMLQAEIYYALDATRPPLEVAPNCSTTVGLGSPEVVGVIEKCLRVHHLIS